MGNQHSRSFVKLLAAMARVNAELPLPHERPQIDSETGKPPRDRAKVKASRKQNRQRKKVGAK